ncbi:hypothetical protein HK096_003026, partial [Nowakowskiella sp. JEL0078]
MVLPNLIHPSDDGDDSCSGSIGKYDSDCRSTDSPDLVFEDEEQEVSDFDSDGDDGSTSQTVFSECTENTPVEVSKNSCLKLPGKVHGSPFLRGGLFDT